MENILRFTHCDIVAWFFLFSYVFQVKSNAVRALGNFLRYIRMSSLGKSKRSLKALCRNLQLIVKNILGLHFFLPSQSIRSVIGQEKLHHFVNQSVQNQTKMRRGNSRFPALQPVFLFLLWILIGSLWWFPLFWLAFLWSLVEITTLDRKTLDWTPWLDYARCFILQGKNLCGENVWNICVVNGDLISHFR